ncbi:MFS transporter [Angelakisella massiliensis]|uniref:MFS transporter n=1 Tax=Angelakisella massiliensis TaxID=1871018 RepID=UPI0024B0EBD4|nr:MFS transporter [Angelakisella massiliensis]
MSESKIKSKVSGDVWILLWVGWLAIALSQILTFGYGMMVPGIMEDFAMDYDTIGSVGAVASWIAVVANIPITAMAARSNPKYSLPSIYLVFAAGCLLFSLANSLPMLYIGRLIAGAGATGLVSCMVVIKIRRVPADKMVEINGIENFVQPLGQTCGTLLMAQILALVGGWRTVYQGICLLMILCAVLWILFYSKVNRRDPDIPVQRPDSSNPSREKEKSPLLLALSQKTVILYALAYPGTIIIWIGFFYYFPSYFMSERGFTDVQAGLATGLFPVFSAIASIVSPKLSKKLDVNKSVLVGSGIALSILYFIILQISSLPLLCLVSAFTGFVSYLPVPLYFTNVYKLGLPPKAVQMATSVLLTMVSLGSALGSSVIGELITLYGLYTGLAVCCATPLWYSLLCLFTPDYSAKAMAKRATEKAAASSVQS